MSTGICGFWKDVIELFFEYWNYLSFVVCGGKYIMSWLPEYRNWFTGFWKANIELFYKYRNCLSVLVSGRK